VPRHAHGKVTKRNAGREALFIRHHHVLGFCLVGGSRLARAAGTSSFMREKALPDLSYRAKCLRYSANVHEVMPRQAAETAVCATPSRKTIAVCPRVVALLRWRQAANAALLLRPPSEHQDRRNHPVTEAAGPLRTFSWVLHGDDHCPYPGRPTGRRTTAE
jgi:hypothetical protein